MIIRGLVICLLLTAEASQKVLAAHLVLLLPLAFALDVWVIADLWPLFLYCVVFWSLAPVAVRLFGYDFETVDEARRLDSDDPALCLPDWAISIGKRHTDYEFLALRIVLLIIVVGSALSSP